MTIGITGAPAGVILGGTLSATIQDVEFEAREGTWMSVDVSADGKTLAFDLLGDIYSMPMAGGEARALTSGPAWDAQPRFSPDGATIAFVGGPPERRREAAERCVRAEREVAGEK